MLIYVHPQAVYIAEGKDRQNVILISAAMVHISSMVLAHENKQTGKQGVWGLQALSKGTGGCGHYRGRHSHIQDPGSW